MSYINNNVDHEFDEEFDEEKYILNQEEINLLYPNANFIISIDLDDIEEILTEQQNIIIKTTFTCGCYNSIRPAEFYYISGEKITYGYVITKLIEQNLTLDCDHCFLEGFHRTNGSLIQFEMVIGS